MSTGTLLEEAFDSDAMGRPQVVAARTPSQLFWRRFRQDRVAIASLGFIVFLSLVAIFAPLVVAIVGTSPPNEINSSLLNDFGLPTGPSFAHPFGVDGLGRDVLSRTVYGARTSLEISILATLIATGIGVVLGMLAGFFGGWVDTVISRSVDVMLAFPVFLLALGLASGCSLGNGCAGGLIQPGITTVVVVIAVVSWTYPARLIRGQVLSLKEKEFVDAARSIGASNSRILFREILPNLMVPIIVYASLMIPTNILLEAALSFLGAGVPAPTASWGAMISDATSIFDTAWWYMLFPGLAILFTALAFNLVGDGLTDAMNPRAAD